VRAVWIASLALVVPLCAQAGLHVGPDPRFLVDGGGRPFLLVGDAAWSLIAQLDLPEAEIYLQDRADRGFNLVMVNLIEHLYCSNPPANAYGDLPFTGAPFVTPNEAYFARADSIITMAAARGITVLLAPAYLGYACGDAGWCAEIENASLANMRTWGRYLGSRYQSFDNIVWLIGGDTDPTPVADKLREMVLGIREFDTGHLMTTHNQPESQAIDPWPSESWLAINSIYTYSTSLYVEAREAYEVSPVMPYFLLESAYENEHGSTPRSLRAESYWTMLSGAFGHVFGNCPIWHFGTSTSLCGSDDWQAALSDFGSTNMTHFRRLFESRHWTEIVPDFDHTVLTGGYGSWGNDDYATAASTADGSSLLAFLPSARTVTFDMSTLTGDSVRCWWYDPADGSTVWIGSFPRGTRSFTPPADWNWVIVIDDAALGFPPPGTPLPPTPAPGLVPASRPPELVQNRPNPFNPATTLEYDLTTPTRVRVEVYDLAGAHVRTLIDEPQAAGRHVAHWDGRDTRGHPVASGVYVVRVDTAQGSDRRKMVLLR
jgi:hypothetical protein